MKSFVVFSEQGEILRHGTCTDDIFDLQAAGSELIVEASPPLQDSYVEINGSQYSFVPKPPKPSEYCKWDYATKQWVPDPDFAAIEVRRTRNRLLANSDWTDTASAPARLGQALYDQWQTYRQALRDITAQPGFPTDVNWPTAP